MERQVSKASESSSVPKLIDESGDATEAYLAIIGQVFRRFDTDGDGRLNLTEFNAMLVASGEEPTDEATFGGFVSLFDDMGEEEEGSAGKDRLGEGKKSTQKVKTQAGRGKAGGKGSGKQRRKERNLAKLGVSLKGFVQMSVMSTLEDPDGECRQLQKLGFDLPREAFPEPTTPEETEEDENEDEMLQLIKKLAAVGEGQDA
jgi:hypothetical protein